MGGWARAARATPSAAASSWTRSTAATTSSCPSSDGRCGKITHTDARSDWPQVAAKWGAVDNENKSTLTLVLVYAIEKKSCRRENWREREKEEADEIFALTAK